MKIKMKMKNSDKGQGGTLAVLVIGLVFGLLLINSFIQEPISDQAILKKFSSENELKNFLEENTGTYSYYGEFGRTFGAPALGSTIQGDVIAEISGIADKGSEDYSTTNIQVAGVDEADIVKNDGRYIYVISGEKVVIVDAYPAENAKILSEIELDASLYEIFINDDKLVVFGRDYGGYESSKIGISIAPRYYSQKTFIKVYDISDRENPIIEKDVSINGSYFDSRMIGDYAYIIINQPTYYVEPHPVPLPVIRSSTGSVEKTIAIPASEVYYFDFPDSSYILTTIVAVNTQDANEELSSKTFLMGYSHSMYASTDNIYIVYTKRLSMTHFYDRIIKKAIIPVVPSNIQNEINNIRNSGISDYEKMQQVSEALQNYVESMDPEQAASLMMDIYQRMEDVQIEISKELEKTIVHKISVDNEKIEYKTAGEVPGYVLNQFSMDEHNGYFRIATTTGNWRSSSVNHLYVLNSDLQIIGKVEDLAEGERIYSARFLGDKGYMVTFRQIDPLFVIDLSNPSSPQVLGYLKIPGVSDYLHPYDETHIIGIGRDATEEGRMLGMKLSLFDITDVENPTEISKYMIGERGTNSEALTDHKAFLFDRSKNLLVIPISLSESGKWNVWQGAYAFNIDLSSGFTLKGRITHTDINDTADGEPTYDYSSQIRRSLYIDDVLYTISNRMIKMNDLDNLNEINSVELPYESDTRVYPMV